MQCVRSFLMAKLFPALCCVAHDDGSCEGWQVNSGSLIQRRVRGHRNKRFRVCELWTWQPTLPGTADGSVFWVWQLGTGELRDT
jgi:hypothetical protein